MSNALGVDAEKSFISPKSWQWSTGRGAEYKWVHGEKSGGKKEGWEGGRGGGKIKREERGRKEMKGGGRKRVRDKGGAVECDTCLMDLEVKNGPLFWNFSAMACRKVRLLRTQQSCRLSTASTYDLVANVSHVYWLWNHHMYYIISA